MLTLHHLEYSQSFRILWLLEELGIDYELKLYERDPETRLAPADYKSISPTGTAPVITDGELTLSESSAIIDYIVEKADAEEWTHSVTSPDKAQHLFWYHASQASWMPLLMMDSVLRIVTGRVPAILRLAVKPVFEQIRQNFLKPRMALLVDKAEQDLAKTSWFGGERISCADISMCYPMESAVARGYINETHRHCQKWLDTVYKRSAFESAKQKDGKECMVLPL